MDPGFEGRRPGRKATGKVPQCIFSSLLFSTELFLQWSPGQFKSGKCRKFEQWYFLESVNAVFVTRWRQGKRSTREGRRRGHPEGDALRREMSIRNFEFQIESKAKTKT